MINYPAGNNKFPVPEEYFDWFDEKEKRGYLGRPSIHLPKWASLIWLKVKRVWVERVQDISEDDAIKEGVRPNTLDGVPIPGEYFKYPVERYEDGFPAFSAKESFQTLWDSIYDTWNENPWVWACEFERTEKPNVCDPCPIKKKPCDSRQVDCPNAVNPHLE
jgi:hypothetical protein